MKARAQFSSVRVGLRSRGTVKLFHTLTRPHQRPPDPKTRDISFSKTYNSKHTSYLISQRRLNGHFYTVSLHGHSWLKFKLVVRWIELRILGEVPNALPLDGWAVSCIGAGLGVSCSGCCRKKWCRARSSVCSIVRAYLDVTCLGCYVSFEHQCCFIVSLCSDRLI